MNWKPGSRDETEGWLLDAYPSSEGMVLWLITEACERVRLVDPFHPSFYIGGSKRDLQSAVSFLVRVQSPTTARPVERTEFFSGKSVPVVRVTVQNPLRFTDVVQRTIRRHERLTFYNCDIRLPQMYFYERHLFPLAFCAVAHSKTGAVRSIHALDSPWDLDYALPPLRRLDLRIEGEVMNPNHGWQGRLEIAAERDCHILEGDDPLALLHRLNDHLNFYDPDLIFTDWGDSFLLPYLRRMARRMGVSLALNRDPETEIAAKPPRSYASYGRMVYTAGAQTLFGRWHIDRQNSFVLSEAGLEGLLEEARVTGLPIQHAARTSTGTGITSMQLETAYRQGILIPWRKREPEEFKTADELLTVDKGGMVFLPPVGFYEEVAELDFASMYPAIMATCNVSPETVGCVCCPENRVPETGYSICTRRAGLVPETLRPLLAKRARYKERMQSAVDPSDYRRYDQRQNALKWLLVVSFGYLGYKNARFGRIEAHECVTAYSREKLLQAKEIAEARGFRLLHAIVDSVWVKKEGATERDYQELVRAISEGTGLPINLEGVYRWIGFLPSRTQPRVSVPNRFLGLFRTGKMKIRGLEIRRSDTPPLIKEAQHRMIELFRRAGTLDEYERSIPQAIEILAAYRRKLHEGQVSLRDLVISRTLSKDPGSYEKASLSAVVAQELAARGVRLDPGESVQYIITNAKDKDPSSRARAYATFTPDHTYDREKYTELLLKAGESLLGLFGYDVKKLDEVTSTSNPERMG